MIDLKETAIERTEDDDHITVFTSERKYINLINKLKEEHPDEVEIIHINDDNSMCVHMPYDWMRFPKPKTKRNLTEEQRKNIAERMKKARESKIENK